MNPKKYTQPSYTLEAVRTAARFDTKILSTYTVSIHPALQQCQPDCSFNAGILS